MKTYPVIKVDGPSNGDDFFVAHFIDELNHLVALGRVNVDNSDAVGRLFQIAAKESGIGHARITIIGPCSETTADEIIDKAQATRRTLPDTLETPNVSASESKFSETLSQEQRETIDRLRREVCPLFPHLTLSDSQLMDFLDEAKKTLGPNNVFTQ